MRKRSGSKEGSESDLPLAPVSEDSLENVSRPTEKNHAAAEMGRRGGLKGGIMRAARMTAEERTASARQAAVARWAKVATNTLTCDGEGHRDLADASGRSAKPLVFRLKPEEALLITEAKGVGGQQALHRRLVAELARGNLAISFNDRQLGELIRYMTRYGSGGFQSRLQQAFRRELGNLLQMRPF